MTAFKLAFRNLLGAGLRTWLNVSVLSFAYVIALFYNGFLEGWNVQARRETMEWETGNGQLWHPLYDPLDPYCLQDAHARITDDLQQLIKERQITPVLVVQGSIYTQGRIQNVLLRGIDPYQNIVSLPSKYLDTTANVIPVVIGSSMASAAKVKEGDFLLLRWRDKNGTFDAREILIAHVFYTNIAGIDAGNIWLPLSLLQEMTGYEGEATYFITDKSYKGGDLNIWIFKDNNYLLKGIEAIIKTKKSGAVLIYGLLLVIGLLAIFDTQVLSVFRRQREIGTYIALGMTRRRVVEIFTIEGATHSILAILLGSLYGIPILTFLQIKGISMPDVVSSYGITISDRIFPAFSVGLILSTTLLVIISATIVSYFPARRISKLKPAEALKSKIS